MSISENIVVQDRYKVVLSVVAFNEESADMVFRRLIDDSAVTDPDNPLVMNTVVYITNPAVF